jgi:hypothetical protein
LVCSCLLAGGGAGPLRLLLLVGPQLGMHRGIHVRDPLEH